MTPVLLHSPAAPPAARYALVSAEPASAPGMVLLRVATGAARKALSGGTAYGPYPETEAPARLQELLDWLRGQGYVPHDGLADTVAKLRSDSREQRALAAQNLGWRRATAAVPALLDAAAQAAGELPLIVDALGRIGDARAIPLCREQAARKLLSRRRSGYEALRNLGDAEGVAAQRAAGLARLPPALAALLAGLDETKVLREQFEALCAAVQTLEPVKRGPAIDQLYELGSPLCVRAALDCLGEEFDAPHLWRYTKSLWKRAMLRGDAASFARLALGFERRRGNTPGQRAKLKSGLDGEVRDTHVFGPRTQRYVVRASARWLRRLAYWRREAYVDVAAEVLARCDETDARTPEGLVGPFGHSLMLHALLHAAGKRFKVDAMARVVARSAAAVTQAFSTAEVPFADRWEARPNGYLRLAVAAMLPDVRTFAVAGVLRHPALLEQASAADLAALVDREAALAELAIAQIERRFDPRTPDLELCAGLLDGGARARALGVRLLQGSAAAWIARAQAVVLLLRRHTQPGRDAAAVAVRGALQVAEEAVRRAVLVAVVAALDALPAQAEPDRASALLELVLAFPQDAVHGRSLEQVLAWIQEGDLPRRTAGGALLGVHPQALEVLGTARLVALADSEVQTVRAAACALVGRALVVLSGNPWPLLTLAETRWPDTRACAFELLQKLDIAQLDLAALVALCDSNNVQVQAFARSWIGTHLSRVDAAGLMTHLVEHPHAPMRAFAMELVEQQLPPGAEALQRIAPFLQSTLLTPRMSRSAKDRLLRVVMERGLQDAAQAAIAAEVLGAALRTAVQRDFEPLVLALTRIQQQFPQLVTDWKLAVTEAAP